MLFQLGQGQAQAEMEEKGGQHLQKAALLLPEFPLLLYCTLKRLARPSDFHSAVFGYDFFVFVFFQTILFKVKKKKKKNYIKISRHGNQGATMIPTLPVVILSHSPRAQDACIRLSEQYQNKSLSSVSSEKSVA